jgi:hypothetical protein
VLDETPALTGADTGPDAQRAIALRAALRDAG